MLEKSLEGMDPLTRCPHPVDVGSAPLSPVCGAEGREGMLCLAWAELCCHPGIPGAEPGDSRTLTPPRV